MRPLIFIALWLIVRPSVGQDADILFDSMASSGPAAAATEPVDRFQLTGILVSSRSGRAALVNGVVAEAGDRVAGAEILAIDDHSVRLRLGSREATVSVGGSLLVTPEAFVAADRGPSPDGDIVDDTDALAASSVTEFVTDGEQRRVAPGETLSLIAQDYLEGDTTLDQVMLALYEANPEAFGGNINMLYEGAILHIPDATDLGNEPAGAASDEVFRQMQAWRNPRQQPTPLVAVTQDQAYGPIARGETLSGIALRLAPQDVTTNQMMVALFEANPEAFGGNINVLFEDAILQVPDATALRRRSPGVATAEVLRQTQIWRTALVEPPTELPANLTAARG